MLQAAANAFRIPDLRAKILFTLGIFIVYRLAASIPVPGVDANALSNLSSNFQAFGMLSLFSGGSSSYSIVVMGVYPYITAQIAIQILQPVIPRLDELSKEGESGRNRINQIVRYVTVPLALLQAFGQGALLSSSGLIQNFGLFDGQTVLPTLGFMFTLTAGTMFLIWLGELITEHGIGNGVSLIIFVGIIARMPAYVSQTIISGNIGLLVLLAVGVCAIVGVIIFMQEAQRRIPVQYAKRVVRGRQTEGQSTFIPLRVNSAGMIPLIFAVSIVYTPSIIASYVSLSANTSVRDAALKVESIFSQTSAFYWLIYFVLVLAFTYFYTDVTFQQQKLAENLQKYGGFIPGYRPGKNTNDYLRYVLNRITLLGALFLGIVAILPWIGQLVTGNTNLALSSTALLIVVAVVLDTMKQLQAQLLMRRYESFIR